MLHLVKYLDRPHFFLCILKKLTSQACTLYVNLKLQSHHFCTVTDTEELQRISRAM